MLQRQRTEVLIWGGIAIVSMVILMFWANGSQHQKIRDAGESIIKVEEKGGSITIKENTTVPNSVYNVTSTQSKVCEFTLDKCYLALLKYLAEHDSKPPSLDIAQTTATVKGVVIPSSTIRATILTPTKTYLLESTGYTADKATEIKRNLESLY